jgi:hypothetical protein
MVSGFVQVTPSSALKLKRGTPSWALVSTSAQLSSLQFNALTPSPPDGGVAVLTAWFVASKRHRRSRPGWEPPARQLLSEQAIEVIIGVGALGSARPSQCPREVLNSPTDVGPTLALDVPTATQTLLRVQPTLERGTEMLSAGVPLRC